MMNYNEYDLGDTVFCCQRNSSLAIGIPGIFPQITGYKKPRMAVPSSSFDFSSSTTVYTFSRRMSGSNVSCPRSLLPYSEDTHDCAPHSWNELPFRKSLSEIALSALQSLQDPVLSPSTSSFSLDEMWYQLFQFRLWCWLGFRREATIEAMRGWQDDPSWERLSVRMDSEGVKYSVKRCVYTLKIHPWNNDQTCCTYSYFVLLD